MIQGKTQTLIQIKSFAPFLFLFLIRQGLPVQLKIVFRGICTVYEQISSSTDSTAKFALIEFVTNVLIHMHFSQKEIFLHALDGQLHTCFFRLLAPLPTICYLMHCRLKSRRVVVDVNQSDRYLCERCEVGIIGCYKQGVAGFCFAIQQLRQLYFTCKGKTLLLKLVLIYYIEKLYEPSNECDITVKWSFRNDIF